MVSVYPFVLGVFLIFFGGYLAGNVGVIAHETKVLVTGAFFVSAIMFFLGGNLIRVAIKDFRMPIHQIRYRLWENALMLAGLAVYGFSAMMASVSVSSYPENHDADLAAFISAAVGFAYTYILFVVFIHAYHRTLERKEVANRWAKNWVDRKSAHPYGFSDLDQ